MYESLYIYEMVIYELGKELAQVYQKINSSKAYQLIFVLGCSRLEISSDGRYEQWWYCGYVIYRQIY